MSQTVYTNSQFFLRRRAKLHQYLSKVINPNVNFSQFIKMRSKSLFSILNQIIFFADLEENTKTQFHTFTEFFSVKFAELFPEEEILQIIEMEVSPGLMDVLEDEFYTNLSKLHKFVRVSTRAPRINPPHIMNFNLLENFEQFLRHFMTNNFLIEVPVFEDNGLQNEAQNQPQDQPLVEAHNGSQNNN